jgi:hypothetical protein
MSVELKRRYRDASDQLPTTKSLLWCVTVWGPKCGLTFPLHQWGRSIAEEEVNLQVVKKGC